jgi:hypothetical protein
MISCSLLNGFGLIEYAPSIHVASLGVFGCFFVCAGGVFAVGLAVVAGFTGHYAASVVDVGQSSKITPLTTTSSGSASFGAISVYFTIHALVVELSLTL